jgi:hypothetical protein
VIQAIVDGLMLYWSILAGLFTDERQIFIKSV